MTIINSQQCVQNNYNIADSDEIDGAHSLTQPISFSNSITRVENNTITSYSSPNDANKRENKEKKYSPPIKKQCKIAAYSKHQQYLNGFNDNTSLLVKKNPISFKSVKIIQKETGGTLYTRTAQYIEYKNNLFRVKNPFYNNYVAAEEVIMGGIFSMTGLGVPKMLLCNDCNDFFVFNKETRGDFQDGKDLSRFACVASKVEPSFKDLGDFLLDEKIMVSIIEKSGIEEKLSDSYIKKTVANYQHLVEIFHKADSELKNIQKEYPKKSYLNSPDILAKIKSKNLKKFTTLEKMNQFLPKKTA